MSRAARSPSALQGRTAGIVRARTYLSKITPIEFIAQISWPTAIVIVALLYRRLLTDLIAGGVTRLRAGPFELAWDQAKSGVQGRPASVEAPATSMDSTEPPVSLLGTEIVDLASTDPRAAVLRAYEAVREAFRRGLKEAGVDMDTDGLDALGLVREAESQGVVPATVTDAVLGLNVLHNLAKHAPSREMSPARAYEYLAMADGALYSFATAVKKHQAAGPHLSAAA